MALFDKKDLEKMLNSIISLLSGVLKVDTLSTESTITVEIDTSAESSPYILLTPPAGKTISTRGVTINTDSSGGEIAVKFANSGELIYKIYIGKFRGQVGIGLNKKGDVDEPVIVEWSGLDGGAKIFIALTYKEE
ncbi:MAG: hypothetical protein H0Z19_09975 [Archaeoglobus sp.]|uniref:hypothetical protein n=1 Tax=Archaeoglobus sp. TaxID=1872626 RepID=UPI001DFF27DA|nr:hypothetical protein [Archaeoglobus sp.]MBO8180783.1 hypothetical protein [Archaeoglobus sp.]